jgi:hypothetical protein
MAAVDLEVLLLAWNRTAVSCKLLENWSLDHCTYHYGLARMV